MLELGDAKRPKFSWGGFSSWVAWRRCGGPGHAPLTHGLLQLAGGHVLPTLSTAASPCLPACLRAVHT